ncbi:hypothetical protein [Rickettsia endosymbiont of Gonocerus acuteangulatus]|uniref:hypothetical protein n=1 Tax=Rickettsia endosymbiont of Gonocerus acuteangulatus TaxID=3066266 RepID=UPI003132E3A9
MSFLATAGIELLILKTCCFYVYFSGFPLLREGIACVDRESSLRGNYEVIDEARKYKKC